MMKLLTLGAALATASAGYPPKTNPFSYGHAVFTYGPLHCTPRACDVVPSCNRAHWSKDIAAYNSNVTDLNSQISTVYTYGGDIEFWALKGHPTACNAPASMNKNECNVSIFYDPQNAAAAEVYRATEGVKSTVALIDSRMDGTFFLNHARARRACTPRPPLAFHVAPAFKLGRGRRKCVSGGYFTSG